MAVAKWLIAGTLGAGIGGVIWVLLGYFADVEVGYVAWGIGLLAGVGVRFKMESHEVNSAAGIAAVAAAMLVIAGSKYFVVRLHVANLLNPILAADDKMDPVELVAGDIVDERVKAGQEINWPEPEADAKPPEGEEGGIVVGGYPEDVLAEARQRWEAMPQAQRVEYEAAKRAARVEQMAQVREAINNEAFKASFGPHDLLWFGLAVFTAFKVGRGMGGSSKEQTPPADQGAQPPTGGTPPTTA
jgi:hypothetical protein